MARYRKRPVEVEAFQLLNGHVDDWPWWAREDDRITIHGDHVEIATLEGVMRGDIGDYVIRGVKGELYPCKPDIFEQTYELVGG